MKLLFLDIDGVLNDHTRTPSGWCGIQPDKVTHLNRILDECPDVHIVISSAWRYLILGGHMTIEGFKRMLCSFGVKAWGRLHGHCGPDGQDLGVFDPDTSDLDAWSSAAVRWRADLCHRYVGEVALQGYQPVFVILDDLALDSGYLVQTDGGIGLTAENADEVIRRFQDVSEKPIIHNNTSEDVTAGEVA